MGERSKALNTDEQAQCVSSRSGLQLNDEQEVNDIYKLTRLWSNEGPMVVYAE